MTQVVHPELSWKTATGRWAAVGPYYAMFPIDFAFDVINEFSKPGHSVLDPFAGRATSIFAAGVLGRKGYGIEINPVGWLYGKVKIAPASREEVAIRVGQLADAAKAIEQCTLDSMPEFFSCCYTPSVLRFLRAARDKLKWQDNQVDATVMTIILIHLHGKIENSFSNQMRQGKAMSPAYSVAWWKKRNMGPPEIDPVEFFEKRLNWRYAKGVPCIKNIQVIKGDSRSIIDGLSKSQKPPSFNLLFTSPPYYDVTDYHYDQWLRLWMLGSSETPTHLSGDSTGRFDSKCDYQALLLSVFQASAQVMRKNAVVYIRTDAREFTLNTTLAVLREVFPKKKVVTIARPFKKKTQTALYGDKEQKPGEMDIILTP